MLSIGEPNDDVTIFRALNVLNGQARTDVTVSPTVRLRSWCHGVSGAAARGLCNLFAAAYLFNLFDNTRKVSRMKGHQIFASLLGESGVAKRDSRSTRGARRATTSRPQHPAKTIV
jgi:hypothetical protein